MATLKITDVQRDIARLNAWIIRREDFERTNLSVTKKAVDPLRTKGDIFVNNGFVSVRLPVGTNTQVLTADPTQVHGLRWAPAGTPGSHVLADTSGLGSEHTTSGLTVGQVLRASGTTTAAFAQLDLSNSSGSVILAQLPFGAANQFLSTNPGATAIEHKTLDVGVSGTDFNIVHVAGTTTFNLPNASPTNRGVVSTVTQSFVGQKTFTGNLIADLAFQVTNNEAQFLAGLQVTGVAQIPSIQSPNVTGDLAIAVVGGNGIAVNEAGGLITLQTGTGNGTGAGGNLLIQPGEHGGSGTMPGVVDFNLPADSGLSIRESGAASPSTVGLVRLPFNRFIYSRNSTNTANIQILGIDSASGTNEVWVGDQALGVGMRTESIQVVSDLTVGDDLFIGTASDGWVFNNVTGPGSLVLIEMPPASASGGEMSLLGQNIAIADGGTGQTTQTAAFNALDPLTTTGDLVVRDSTNSIRLAVGTNNQVLTADSAQASGVRWATPAAGVGGYALLAQANTRSPADAETLFFGIVSQGLSSAANKNRVIIPKAGNIVRFDMFMVVNGALGTSETVNYHVRLNNTTDNLTIATTLDAVERQVSATGSVAVVAGDYIEIKVVYPTWVTNPGSVVQTGIIFIE